MITEEEKIESLKTISSDQIFEIIWSKPRLAFHYIKHYKCKKLVYTLLFLGGVLEGFNNSLSRSSGDSLSLIAIILLSIILAGLTGWISFYISSAFLGWTGSWFGGVGKTDELLRMFSLALIPSLFSLVLIGFKIVIFEKAIFQSSFDINDYSQAAQFIYFIMEVLEYILSAWTLVLLVIGISEVHEISITKSVLSLTLPAAVVIGFLYLLFYILS